MFALFNVIHGGMIAEAMARTIRIMAATPGIISKRFCLLM
jgi:hypothetical protein